MNTERVQKAMQKTSLKHMARMALNAAADLDPEQAAHVVAIVGHEFIVTEDGDELSVYKLRNYLAAIISPLYAPSSLEMDG